MFASVRFALTTVSNAIQRAFAPFPAIEATHGHMVGETVTPEFDPENALSGIAGYPWARVGITAVAVDCAALPLTATVNGEAVADHWLIRLLQRPDRGWSGVRWRRQLLVDYRGAGNAFVRILRNASGRPVRLRRLHPRSVNPVVSDGEIVHWEYTQPGKGPIVLAVDEVMHIANVGWREGPLEHLGESPMRPLAVSILAAINARKQAGKASKRGRVEMLLSPTADMPLGTDGAKRIADSYLESATQGSGVVVISQGITAVPMSLSPRDTEWENLDIRTRDETLAVFGVPPTRAQLPTANYGAAKQEMRQYWEGAKHEVSVLDAELSYLADPAGSTIIAHDFTAVEALQTSYTERLTRASMWIAMGATPYEAAIYEGFVKPPLSADTEPRGSVQVPANPAAQDAPQAQAYARVRAALAACATVIEAAGVVDDFARAGLHIECAAILTDALQRDATDLARDIVDAAVDDSTQTDIAGLFAFSDEHAAHIAGGEHG